MLPQSFRSRQKLLPKNYEKTSQRLSRKDSDRVRKRQLSHEEKEILKEMKERNLRQQHNQPIKNIYNIV